MLHIYIYDISNLRVKRYQELAIEFHAKGVGITPIRSKIKFIQLLFRRPISDIFEICSVTLYTNPEKGETALLLCLHFMPCITAH